MRRPLLAALALAACSEDTPGTTSDGPPPPPPPLRQGEACDTADDRCDRGLVCFATGSAATCEPSCDPRGGPEECGTDACLPLDYHSGRIDSDVGACAPFLNAADAPCLPELNICGEAGGAALACADVDGDGAFTCVVSCDVTNRANDCNDVCVPLSRLHEGGDPRLGVCLATLARGDLCDADADRCGGNDRCFGNITIGWACRQVVGASGSCGGGTAEIRQGDNDSENWCLPTQNCSLFAGDPGPQPCGPGDTCVAYIDEGQKVETCVNEGSVALGGSCDASARCVDAAACLGEPGGGGVCRELCATSGGTWPNDCGRTGTTGGLCASGGCCIDFTCFDETLTAGQGGVRLPDYSGCDVRAQTGCAAGETCFPQHGAWARGHCQAALGTAGPGERCEPEATGEWGCAAGNLCLDFFGADAVCVPICNPALARDARCGPWPNGQRTSCIDANDISGAPDNEVGLCLPLCSDDGDCDGGQTCFELDPGATVGICQGRCDMRVDGACDPGGTCIPEPADQILARPPTAEYNGSGTCDGRSPNGRTPCNADGDCASNVCVPSALSAGGFCAEYGGSTPCDATTGAGCATGEACYAAPSGDTYCAPQQTFMLTRCNPATDGCGADTCIRIAPDGDAQTDDGACLANCDFDANAFPSQSNCGAGQICYEVPAGSGAGASTGFCAFARLVPGGPVVACDPDATSDPDAACESTVGELAQCVAVTGGAATYSPTLTPRGLCVPRCFANARGDFGACAFPGTCVPDVGPAVDGMCLDIGIGRDPCDPLTQDSCAAYQTCQPVFGFPPTGALTGCNSDIGLAQRGEACGNASAAERCDLGLWCVPDTAGGRECAAFCAAAADCDPGETCVDISFAYWGSSGRLGVCLRDDGCDLVAQDCLTAESCVPVGFVTHRTSVGHARQCVRSAATGPIGAACRPNDAAPNGNCATGLFCGRARDHENPPAPGVPLLHPTTGDAIDYCTAFCDPATAVGNTDCPSNTGGFGANQVCVDVSAQLNEPPGAVGLCVK